ncbi:MULTISPECIES: YgjV family protein [unclassified Alteromonas]|uniref:YgjV family protein n=1 Tax=unclassified Alteromonas TaxID=2614992 RepID=UPI000509AD5E|nr:MULTISPECIES: YgjV family protein [unclassified Alteromonas]
MSYELLGQIFGVLAFLVATYSFTHKSDIKLKLSLIVMFSFQTAHFFFLGSVTGTIANFLNFFRTIISIKANHRYIGALFIVINIVWGAFNVHQPVDLCPIFGACFGTYAIFYADGILMRKLFICGAFFWLTNNVYLGSVGGVLLEVSVIIANSITIYRLQKDLK